MIELSTLLALAAFAAIPIAWLLPARLAFDGVAVWTAIVLTALSWQTAAWLILASLLVCAMLALGDRNGRRDSIAALLVVLLLAVLVWTQLGSTAVWIGSSFFTLRLLHVVGDWWTGELAAPSLRRTLRYQLFLPVLFVGPVNRIQIFERQLERRRWEAAAFLSGCERILVGFFSASVVGEYGRMLAQSRLDLRFGQERSFLSDWASSAIDWVSLYFVFAGLTSTALGISLMMGLRLEENFNQPWRATSLIDFWTRWHMSLTSWCRDYVFKPVAALSRSALAGLVTAMVVVGLWHEISLYYVLWAVWQALGVVLNRTAARWFRPTGSSKRLLRVAGPFLIFGWLSLARPVISHLLDMHR